MRSVCILTSYSRSIVAFRGGLIQLLISNGSRVFVFAPDHSQSTREAIGLLGAIPMDYPLYRSHLNPINDIRALTLLCHFFIAERIDSVLTYFFKPNVWATPAAFFARVPTRIALVEGMGLAFSPSHTLLDFLRKSFASSIVKILYGISLRLATKVVVLNPDDGITLASWCFIKPSKIYLLGGIGVDLNKWKFSVPPIYPFTFTFVARLMREKGLSEFLSAALIVKRAHPAVRFLVIGQFDLSHDNQLVDQLASAVNSEAVEWIKDATVDDVLIWLRRTSVFVLPSYYREGVPRSIQEALAIGRPIITTNLPGCRETVVDGRNGFFVPCMDHLTLSSSMLSFLQDPECVLGMGAFSRHIAEQRFDAHAKNCELACLLR